jgi:farnesyl-diphosphate farnesyltransferase
VTLSYLLFRVADTLEDATRWNRKRRIDALHAFRQLLRDDAASGLSEELLASWTRDPPSSHAGYRALIGEFPALLAAIRSLPPVPREIVLSHAARTVDGMAAFQERGDERGRLLLTGEHDLAHYCYIVAGIVGELLTELFLSAAPSLLGASDVLRGNAVAFGEALQLVNILRDVREDANEGRIFIPHSLDRGSILSRARRDLNAASVYVRTLEAAGAPRGFVAFTLLPLLLARATLDLVEREGAGAKLTRHEVARLMSRCCNPSAQAPAFLGLE